jgi:hypothetical protein
MIDKIEQYILRMFYYMQSAFKSIDFESQDLDVRWVLFSACFLLMLFFMFCGLKNLAIVVMLTYISYKLTANDIRGKK